MLIHKRWRDGRMNRRATRRVSCGRHGH